MVRKSSVSARKWAYDAPTNISGPIVLTKF